MTNTQLHARNILQDHTLVVPTYNRPKLLKRLATFYAHEAPSMHLIVLDSSTPENAAENSRMLAALPNQARHVVFPNTIPMAAKIRDGLGNVSTSTVSLCADDDLVFPDGMLESIEFLGNAPDYVSAHGMYINFGEHGQRIHIMREYAGQSNDASHPGARIFRLYQNYESIFYGVFRTNDLRDVFGSVASIPTLHFQELFQSCAALLKGKVKRISHIYAARRSGPVAEPDRDKWQTYYWFADNPAEVMVHYVEYREALWRFYKERGQPSNFDRTSFEKAMDLSHSVYFSKGCPPAYFHSILQPLWPDDVFIKQQDDLFRALNPMGRRRPLAGMERLVIKILRRLRRLQRPRRSSVADVENAIDRLNESIAAKSATAWTCELPQGLRWLAGNDDFQTKYRELCTYLDSGPP